jgi:hypothetical protein
MPARLGANVTGKIGIASGNVRPGPLHNKPVQIADMSLSVSGAVSRAISRM